GGNSGNQKHPPANVYAVFKILQPFIHCIVSKWKCDDRCKPDNNYKIPGDERYDACIPRPQNFSNADLLRSAIHDQCSEAQQAHAGNEDGKNGCYEDHHANMLFLAVLGSERFVEKMVIKILIRSYFLPGRSQEVNVIRKTSRCKANAHP